VDSNNDKSGSGNKKGLDIVDMMAQEIDLEKKM
jgi:hypothetical protein